jgi:tetratricopeptide (TPR) repeat protein
MLLLGSARVVGAADSLNEALQKRLLEEEANHNLEGAIQAYQSVINQYEDQRKLSATAPFRLGECYRKQGKTNEAVAQYQRVLHDFADQSTLATLSQQNLASLGATPQAIPRPGEAAPAEDEEAKEIQRLKSLVKDSPDLLSRIDGRGYAPLHWAVEKGQLSVATFLVENGANLNSKSQDRQGNTPLHLAVLHRNRLPIS